MSTLAMAGLFCVKISASNADSIAAKFIGRCPTTVGVCIATKAFQVDDVFIGVVQAQRGVDGVEVVFGFKVE